MDLKKGIPERLRESYFGLHITGGAFEEQLKRFARAIGTYLLRKPKHRIEYVTRNNKPLQLHRYVTSINA